jgi:hypothetical protein
MLAGRRGAKKTTADLYGMTNKKQATGIRRPTGVSTRRRPPLLQEDRPAGPYIEALVNPS